MAFFDYLCMVELIFFLQNLNQNPRTLLPKFFGLYCYRCNSKNVRLVAMNNLLPSAVKLHQKYDLKGSTYKRKVNIKIDYYYYYYIFFLTLETILLIDHYYLFRINLFFFKTIYNWGEKKTKLRFLNEFLQHFVS